MKSVIKYYILNYIGSTMVLGVVVECPTVGNFIIRMPQAIGRKCSTPQAMALSKVAANIVNFDPVRTSAMELEIVQGDYSAGVFEWSLK